MPARLAVAAHATPPTRLSNLDHNAAVDVRYRLVADADPGMLPRLLEAFAKLGLAPSHFLARTVGDGTEFSVDIRGERLAPRTAELIEFGLRRVLGVHHLVALTEPSLDNA
jgi:hypothetical protein